MLDNHSLVWIELALLCWLNQFKIENINLQKKKQDHVAMWFKKKKTENKQTNKQKQRMMTGVPGF